MKRLITLMTMALMISLLAAGAYAQEQPGPNETKEPRQNYENVPGVSGNGGINRNGAENQHPDEPGDHFNGDPDGQGPKLKPGPDEDKLFIDEDGDGINDCVPQENLYGGESGTAAMSGTMTRNSYGPGEPQPVEGPGPFDTMEDPFGPGVSSGEGVPVMNSEPTASQSRPGGSQ